MRSFVALINRNGYQAVPVLAADLERANVAAQALGDVVAVLDQSQVTALGMALATARVAAEREPVRGAQFFR